jgi:hypothetical protein
MKKGKKRNPNDATMRNIWALKKRVFNLEHRERELYELYDGLEARWQALMKAADANAREKVQHIVSITAKPKGVTKKLKAAIRSKK